MKACIIALALVSFSALAQRDARLLSESQAPVKDQLTHMGSIYPSSTTLPVGDGSASVMVERWEGSLSGFGFRSRGANGGERTYKFEFPERARQGIRLRLTDDAQIASAGLSANLLETSIYFFPRRVVPSATSENGTLIVTLPTGETMQMDAESGRLNGGVLTETAPQDVSPNRHTRRFAALAYSGEGVMIRVDRRAGIPEEVYTQSFNSNEDIANATVTYRGRTCRVPKNLLFQQGEFTNSYPLHADDESLFQLLSARCNWRDLPTIDLTALNRPLDPARGIAADRCK